MTFKRFEVIDASRGSASLRYRRMGRVKIGSFTLHIPLSLWRPCSFHRGEYKRHSKHHCDMCAKYQGWVD